MPHKPAAFPFERLPTDVASRVYAHLDTASLGRLASTSRCFRECFRHVTKLEFVVKEEYEDNAVARAASFASLVRRTAEEGTLQALIQAAAPTVESACCLTRCMSLQVHALVFSGRPVAYDEFDDCTDQRSTCTRDVVSACSAHLDVLSFVDARCIRDVHLQVCLAKNSWLRIAVPTASSALPCAVLAGGPPCLQGTAAVGFPQALVLS